MNTGAEIVGAQRTSVEELALSLGFKTDEDFLIHAAKRRELDEGTRAAYIDTYLKNKEAGRSYEPFFILPFKERAERLRLDQERLRCEEEAENERLSRRQRRQKERRRASHRRRH